MAWQTFSTRGLEYELDYKAPSCQLELKISAKFYSGKQDPLQNDGVSERGRGYGFAYYFHYGLGSG
jgi:hypothetical protein